MLITKQIQKLVDRLRQTQSRTRQVFNTTHLPRILRKHVLETQADHGRKEFTTEEWIRCLLLMQIQKMPHVRSFVRQLTQNAHWQAICGWTGNVPTQSQFSRRIPDSRIHEVLIRAFQTYNQLIPLKRRRWRFTFSPTQLDLLAHRFHPFYIDCTSLAVSPHRYKYAQVGYVAMEKRALPSVRLHVIMDGLQGSIVNHAPTAGNEHESPVADQLLQETGDIAPWLESGLFDEKLRPLMVFDRGYWKNNRFHELDHRAWGWVIPWKKRTLVGAQLEMLEFPSLPKAPLELLVWPSNSSHPWRRVIGELNNEKEQVWDLLTGDLSLKASTILTLGKERGAIEQLFAWLKQQTTLKQPLGTSWMGFVAHCLLVALLHIVLAYFLLLLGHPRWQRIIRRLQEDLQYSDQTPWPQELMCVSEEVAR